jgi:hypothetical protein
MLTDIMTLEIFLRNFIETLNKLMYQPAGSMQLILTAILAIVAMGFILSKIHAISGSGNTGVLIGGVTTLVIVFAMLSIYTMIELKVLPHIADPKLQTAAHILLMLAAFFALAIPFTRLIFNTSYWVSFGAWVVAIVVSWAIVFGVSIFFNRFQYVEQPTMQDVKQNAEEAAEKAQEKSEELSRDAEQRITN